MNPDSLFSEDSVQVLLVLILPVYCASDSLKSALSTSAHFTVYFVLRI